MNTIRKYIKHLPDKDLRELWNRAQYDTTPEGLTVYAHLTAELREREQPHLYRALHQLGIIKKTVTIEWRTDRIVTYIDGEYFGVWDIWKHTFVD